MASRTSTRSSNRGQQTTNDRPPLPMNKYNEMLSATVEGSECPPVKFQPIKKEGQTIIVGRVKVPTPAGHAYVLRRYDTGSVSLTTMWKAAFPTASTAAEKDETNWVKKHFDISGPPETIRLAGTWLPVPIAQQLSAEYKLTKTIEGLAKAEPGNDAVIRSHENGMVGTHDSPNVPPSKRRKAASPKSSEKKPASSSARTTRSSVDTAAATASPRLSVPRQLRSGTKSPGPATRSTPSRAVKSKIMTPPAEKDDPLAAAAADTESELNPDADIAESKALVDKLKAEHNGPSSKTATPAKALPKRGAAAKRAREEAEDVLPNGKPLIKMDFDAEPADPNIDREIASNKRIVKWRQSLPSLPQLEPKQKSAAWGTLAFALAIGATTYIPQFF